MAFPLRRLHALLRTLLLSFLVLGAAASCSAAWYWPFDFNPDSTNKPPRLHRLLEKANDYIELAEDEALSGEGDKAIENYRLALSELDRVEAENPERADSPEFAPLRNKRATCTAAIDAIRFEQITLNARAVALTNTKELEKKWRRKHNLLTPEDIAEDKAEEARKKAEKDAKAEKDGEGDGQVARENKDGTATPRRAKDGASFESRRTEALNALRRQDYAAADALLKELAAERPDDLQTALMSAAAEAGRGRDHAARRTLEAAMKAHPESYLPCYNLASITLKLGEPVAEARRFYEKGRALGGPRNEALEENLK